MDKIFDHRYPSKGWIEVTDVTKEIEDRFDEERWCDRDGAATYVIEHWSEATDTIRFYIADVTGWHYGNEPYMTVSYTDDPKVLSSESLTKPTPLDPRRDYILLGFFPPARHD